MLTPLSINMSRLKTKCLMIGSFHETFYEMQD
jgi:hypothetical protein